MLFKIETVNSNALINYVLFCNNSPINYYVNLTLNKKISNQINCYRSIAKTKG